MRFILISILNTTSVKIFITFFLIWSIFCLLTLRNNINPSSRHKPELFLSIIFAKRNPKSLETRIFLRHHNSPSHCHTKTAVCVFLFPRFLVVIRKWFAKMFNYSQILVWYICVLSCKTYFCISNAFSYTRVKFCYV